MAVDIQLVRKIKLCQMSLSVGIVKQLKILYTVLGVKIVGVIFIINNIVVMVDINNSKRLREHIYGIWNRDLSTT